MRWVISDIHGCSKTFRALLGKISLRRDDTLFLLGDYGDRGFNTKEVYDVILWLIDNCYKVQPIMGNHEDFLLNAIGAPAVVSMWMNNGGLSTLQSFGVSKADDIPPKYLNFIRSLPLTVVTDDYVLVHASLDFSTKNPIQDTDKEYCLWERSFKGFMTREKIGGRRLIMGHTITEKLVIEEAVADKRDYIYLDNGCFVLNKENRGCLTAMNLDSNILVFQKNCEPPPEPYRTKLY